MSKTQKKNHKRKYDRQRQRMADEGVTDEDFKPETNPMQWSQEIRDKKLNFIKVKFPMSSDKANASRFDYTSLLNVVCQKLRINLPEYQPCGAIHGGFAFRCRVHLTWYQGQEFASTKKDAKHECAKWALLHMDIPGYGDTSVLQKRVMPVHPRLRNNASQEGEETGRLMEAGIFYPKKVTLRKPKLESVAPTPNSPQRNTAPENSMESYLRELQEEEQKQEKVQAAPNPMEEYLRQQREEEELSTNVQPQNHQAPSNSPAAWGNQGAWGRPPPQARQQAPPPQMRPQAPQPQYRPQTRPQAPPPSQPQKSWGGWGAQSQQPANIQQALPVHTVNDIQQSMSGVSLDSSDDWKTVPKKASGVNSKARGRGRGRGTTMKKW